MIFWVLTNVKHIWSVEQENVSLHRFSVVTHKHKAHLGYFNQHMESSSKVRSVTRTADGDSLFFCPHSWSECKRRLNTPRIIST